MSEQQDHVTLENVSLDRELELAINLSQQAGSLVQTIRVKGYKVYDKGRHLGLVTDADKAASQLLLKEIAQAFPNDLIISEEEPIPPEDSNAKRIWFIDPIDGTNDFIAGSNEWSIMLGLAINGKPCLGVVYQADTNELYYATQGKGAFYSSSKETLNLQVRAISDLTQTILIQSRSHWSSKAQEVANQLGISHTLKYGSLGLKLGKIAKGEADLYFNFSGRCHLWDLCGPEIILQEAGGKVLLASGEQIIYGQGETLVKTNFVAATNKLANKIYHVLK
ncbi:3'(2'),5'-bisphosphate nucleotidase CysQ family protein [Legionella brunensis]|uniref:Inositol monophosphatase n=1 Tax=Legionella brunensis TaxID=29422 RepID=A0A0W0S3V7_9GAMM|nr:3'(2'),5'-bisphosphate nucleotidase CysQ [Legionella brunensis]KTC78010.1 inositol monophosphatase [Legionella brunensis]